MTAYDFTNLAFSPIQLRIVQEKYDSPKQVASKIERDMKVDLRSKPKYEEAKDMFIELTMSCNLKEAKGWMTRWMLSAIAYGLSTKDLDWRYFYLAAYDIFIELS